MAGLTSTQDIKKDVLARCGELTDGTSEYEARVVNYIDYWHKTILAGSTELNIECGDPWPWARAQYPGVLNLQPYYTTGYVSVIHDSTACTFTVPPSFSAVGWYLKIEGRAEYFRVAAHVAAAASFTLDGNYTEDTGSNLSFILYKLEYTLPAGILRLAAPMRCYRRQSPYADDTGQIDGIDRASLDRDYPLHRILQGIPDRFAVSYIDSSTGTMRIRFNRIPYFETRVEFDYIPIPTDLTDSGSSIPLLPIEHRIVLSYAASYYLLTDKNDNRYSEYKNLASTALQALIESSRRIKGNLQKDMGRLIPRRDLTHYTRRYYSQEVSQ